MIKTLNAFKGMNTEYIKTEKPTTTEMPLNKIPFPEWTLFAADSI